VGIDGVMVLTVIDPQTGKGAYFSVSAQPVVKKPNSARLVIERHSAAELTQSNRLGSPGVCCYRR
jgi:hypothetical protein